MLRERRRYFRHPVDMPVRISIPEGAELNATGTDLSEGGMAIHVAGKLPWDVVTNLHFTLPGSNISLELRGNITWADASGKAGIRFVEVPQSSQYQLEKWLTDRIKSELPTELHPHLNAD
jgi:c-di-GMP-binding flagellar brake protein YcgR